MPSAYSEDVRREALDAYVTVGTAGAVRQTNVSDHTILKWAREAGLTPDVHPVPHLDVTPLVASVDRAGGLAALLHRGDSDYPAVRKAYKHAKRRGSLTIYAADRLAVRLLGLHPSLLWPDEWKAA